MTVLEAHNLSKSFGRFKAVDDVSFSLTAGEILGLLGPNGAGKTTIIQMLLGILTPGSGRISYFGKDLFTNRSEILEAINFSSTYTNFPWNLTVADNLHYLSYLYRITDRKARVAQIVEEFNLGSLLKKKIVVLSAGEITRVNLAKAFMNAPRLVLLDEPTASLDVESAHFVRAYIAEQRRLHGLSVVFTSHNMAEVERLCDRVMFMNAGKILVCDTPANLARSLERCRLRIVVEGSRRDRFSEMCRERNVAADLEGDEFSVELKEAEAIELLKALSIEGLTFHGISIEKPGLEDYFLKLSRENGGPGWGKVN